MSQRYSSPYSALTTVNLRPTPSSTLTKLISENIPREALLKAAEDALSNVQKRVKEAETAKARLQSFLESCRAEEDRSIKVSLLWRIYFPFLHPLESQHVPSSPARTDLSFFFNPDLKKQC